MGKILVEIMARKKMNRIHMLHNELYQTKIIRSFSFYDDGIIRVGPCITYHAMIRGFKKDGSEFMFFGTGNSREEAKINAAISALSNLKKSQESG